MQLHQSRLAGIGTISSTLPSRVFFAQNFARQRTLSRPARHSKQQHTPAGLQRCRTPLRLQLICLSAHQEKVSGQKVADNSVSLVLLAGGVGKRMGASVPKQYLELNGQPIATYSMQTFAAMPEVREIVVVCEQEWRAVFQECYGRLARQLPLKFALPGPERQDSVHSGFQEIDAASDLVAVHDSARPLITSADALRCFQDALEVGAAVLGVPVKPTIKEVDAERRVVQTLQRAKLWEVQTPQVMSPVLLREGFELVKRERLEVTDDVSIIEALGKPVQVTPGSYTNIKVTTPDDMSVAERFLEEQKRKSLASAAV